MSKLVTFLLLLAVTALGGMAQTAVGSNDMRGVTRVLEQRLPRFAVEDAVLRDGISELSLANIEGLHLGFEEIIRGRIQDDPRGATPHFSLSLGGKSVRQILDSLCQSDPRYTWSGDGESINVYPRAAMNDPSYLPRQRIQYIRLSAVPDPDQALTPLSKLFPDQQVGYLGGGEDSYAEPWTIVLEHLTVRQFVNRISEHMGVHTTWVLQGGEEERMFTFFKGGFHSFRAPQVVGVGGDPADEPFFLAALLVPDSIRHASSGLGACGSSLLIAVCDAR